MTTLSSDYLRMIQSQHSLQGADLALICHLAQVEGTPVENLLEKVQSWRFEQFLGFTLHLFITTESPRVRVQLAKLLPKFGSSVVRSLVKIVYHFKPTSAVGKLAQKSLHHMPLKSLMIGLIPVFELDNVDAFMPIVRQELTQRARYNGESVLLSLAEFFTSGNLAIARAHALRKHSSY
ncbi:MAG: hypothetical protein HC800_01945 [Phormidesmis sp. RL_2_1]|nr:hypothetical protein [Phormidesmis sp. RL_2_1]